MEISFVKYLRGNVTIAGAIPELKASIQHKIKMAFVEVISLIKQHSGSNTENILGWHQFRSRPQIDG